jgi:hypothetical protein
MGNTFQDLPWLRETVDNTERYTVYGAPSKARNLTSYIYIYGPDFLLGILLLDPCISLIYT